MPYISSVQYIAHTGDEIAIITTAPSHITEITPNHEGYDVSFLTSSCFEKPKYALLYI